MKEEHNDPLTPDERSELNALLDGVVLKLTAKQWRERRHKLHKLHKQQKWNLLKAYGLSPTQELASQLSQLGFDEIDGALFRLHELEGKGKFHAVRGIPRLGSDREDVNPRCVERPKTTSRIEELVLAWPWALHAV